MKNSLGIVITGGKCPHSHFTRQLLRGKDVFIVAADSGLLHAEEAELKPDYIIGDMDSVGALRLAAYPADCIIRHSHDKDYTDTELAFKLAVDNGCGEIWIIGGGGGRLDHLFGIRSLFEREIFPRRWITDNADIWCIESSLRPSADTLTAKVEKNAVVSVFPLGSGPWKAASEGLKWQLDGIQWPSGSFGLSNAALSGEFFIRAEKGRFMVILPPSLLN